MANRVTKNDPRRTNDDEGQRPKADEKVIEDGRAGIARTASLLRRILRVVKPHEEAHDELSG